MLRFIYTQKPLTECLDIYFERMIPELQLNKANTLDTGFPVWIYVYLFLTVLYSPKCRISAMTLILILRISPLCMGTSPVVPLMECIFQNLLGLLSIMSSYLDDFKAHNKCLTANMVIHIINFIFFFKILWPF